jgi:excisionase family DNA binding protein
MNELKPVSHQIPRASQTSGLSRAKLYEFMKSGELPYVKIGRRRLIADDDLRALIGRHRVAAEPAPQRSKLESEASAPTDPPRRRGRPRKATEPAPLEAG